MKYIFEIIIQDNEEYQKPSISGINECIREQIGEDAMTVGWKAEVNWQKYGGYAYCKEKDMDRVILDMAKDAMKTIKEMAKDEQKNCEEIESKGVRIQRVE